MTPEMTDLLMLWLVRIGLCVFGGWAVLDACGYRPEGWMLAVAWWVIALDLTVPA